MAHIQSYQPSDEMDRRFERFEEIRDYRTEQLKQVRLNHQALNQCHDIIMKQTVLLAMKQTESELGPPPTHFVFFVMGSAGRTEQSVLSDQDHGIIYENVEHQHYFLALGANIEEGLVKAGYERCDGMVMASNPRWCKEKTAWKNQLQQWIETDTWESLRYLLTFFDSRSLVGTEELLYEAKHSLLTVVEEDDNGYFLKRVVENTGRFKRGVGLFGQLLVETGGEFKGLFDLKRVAFFPYVNALRILALKEHVLEPSTIGRFNRLADAYQLQAYQASFEALLDKRLKWQQGIEAYERIHYLNLKRLSKDEKRQLKKLTKEGQRLYRNVEKHVIKGWSAW
ncbi:DUF294 nucleotidyltransferase-like domain-containing protein [Halalkalibacterium ligniniphilum]|uniref:DUF294 nucleotidyltransferase-like domain-containing protein n=1 Tax=Halalkalibacterium ligniniphilum TaxID=1134413 RepID=UPI00034822A3|nr:DUF294 nucleotidyltransferase-like domain-containing protein [Halalkalibacterium ligniniphilum]